MHHSGNRRSARGTIALFPRRQLLRAGAALLASLAGLARTGRSRSASASICGFDTSQDVELYDGSLGVTTAFVAAARGPVGNLRWSGDLVKRYTNPGNVNAMRWCSGTLVADDLYLTAGSCLDNRPLGWTVPRQNATDAPLSRAEVATNMRVEFNYQLGADGTDRQPESFAVVEVVEDRLDDLDYAILRLEDAPGQRFGVTRLATEDVSVGQIVGIIGHPEGQQKRIDAGPVIAIEDIRLFYDVNTLGGSGGSGVLASPGGQLVAVHTNGGCEDPTIGGNYGVTIAGLLQVSPTLRNLAGV